MPLFDTVSAEDQRFWTLYKPRLEPRWQPENLLDARRMSWRASTIHIREFAVTPAYFEKHWAVFWPLQFLREDRPPEGGRRLLTVRSSKPFDPVGPRQPTVHELVSAGRSPLGGEVEKTRVIPELDPPTSGVRVINRTRWAGALADGVRWTADFFDASFTDRPFTLFHVALPKGRALAMNLATGRVLTSVSDGYVPVPEEAHVIGYTDEMPIIDDTFVLPSFFEGSINVTGNRRLSFHDLSVNGVPSVVRPTMLAGLREHELSPAFEYRMTPTG